MNKSIFLLFLSIIQFQQSESLSITVPNEKLKAIKRDAVYGDLSYSYSATDVGAEGGGHVKTVTVIKNISKGKHDYTNSDEKKNIKLIVKWPEITADVFSTLDFFTSATTAKIESEEKIAETKKTESNNEEQNTIVETKTETVQMIEDEKKPEKQMEVVPKQDVPKQEVELLEPSQPIGLNAAIQSAKAQAHAQYLRSRIDNAVAMGGIAKNSEYTQRLRAPFIEDFSDFSMHTIRHLNKPNPKKEISVTIVKNEPYIAPILRTKIPK